MGDRCGLLLTTDTEMQSVAYATDDLCGRLLTTDTKTQSVAYATDNRCGLLLMTDSETQSVAYATDRCGRLLLTIYLRWILERSLNLCNPSLQFSRPREYEIQMAGVPFPLLPE